MRPARTLHVALSVCFGCSRFLFEPNANPSVLPSKKLGFAKSGHNHRLGHNGCTPGHRTECGGAQHSVADRPDCSFGALIRTRDGVSLPTPVRGEIVGKNNFLYHSAPIILTLFHLEDHCVSQRRHSGNSGFHWRPGCNTRSATDPCPGSTGCCHSPLAQADARSIRFRLAFHPLAGYRAGPFTRCPRGLRNQSGRQVDGHWPEPADDRVRSGWSIALAGSR